MKAIANAAALWVLCLLVVPAPGLTLQNFTIEGRYFYDTQNSPITGVCTDGHFLYLTQQFDSLKIYSLTSDGLPLERLGACQAHHRDYLYQAGHLIIGVGYNWWEGFGIYDISDVYSPIQVSNRINSNVIFKVKIVNNMLYVPFGVDIGEENFKIYDLSNIADPLMIADYNFGAAWGWGFDLKGNIGYLTHSDWDPVYILDISDYHDIRIIGSIYTGGSAIKIYGNSLFLGPHFYDNNQTVGIYSLANPQQPILQSTLNYGLYNTTDIQIDGGLLYAINDYGKITVCDIGGYDSPESLGAAILPAPFLYPQMAIKGNTIYYAAGDSGLYVLRYTGEMPINTGDANSSGTTNGIDVIYMANYFRGWVPLPAGPRERGDTNGDCTFNGIDETYLVNYLKGGPPPIRGFCYGQ
jgi:hypothetical protein